MRTMMTGLSGWVKMQDTGCEALKTVDAALTVVATLMVAVTWMALK